MLLVSLCIGNIGCAAIDVDTATTQNETSVNSSTGNSNEHFKDNDLLYADDVDDSVVTMYLTVSKGNSSENTNHTWEEINTYSAYDYDEMGVERYAVNGLLQVGDENGPVEGELGYGKYVPNATVTIRGQTSTRNKYKNYKIRLKDEAGTWNDQKTINLNKHQSDGSRFRNKLCYDLLEELPGMMALQTQFVHLYVKDETADGANAEFVDYGLYTQVEQPNKSFLERHGLDKYGHLYKINFFEFYRYEDEIMLKNDLLYNQSAFEERIEIKGDDDHSKLIAMLEDVNNYMLPMETVVSRWFDEENIASWMAFQILVGNVDTQSRNTLIYSPLNDNTWYFISWDCDGSFVELDDSLHELDTERGWEHGVSNYWGNVLFQRLLKEESFREILDRKIEEYRSIVTEDKLESMIATYTKVTKKYLYQGADKLNARFTESEYNKLCNLLPKEIEKNYELYKESLEEPMPFYIGTPKIEEQHTEFNWDTAYDFDSEDVFYTFELADNLEFENPIVIEEGLYLPEYSYDGILEPGQYFIRVTAKNESGKEQTAFDYYVTTESQKKYGVFCFYVLQDGSIGVEIYEE